jgi:ketosteroid isomerase-like protein
MDDRHEAAREVIRQLHVGEDWAAAVEDDLPPQLMEITAGLLAAYRDVDLDWLIEHTDPDVEIVQLSEIPDSRTYTGPDALVEALLDWPRQWDDFRMEPRRIFAFGDDQLLMVALHKGRPPSMDIEVEAEIIFRMRWRDGLLTRWDMFLTLDEALSRAAEGGADGDDDHAAERHGRERA